MLPAKHYYMATQFKCMNFKTLRDKVIKPSFYKRRWIRDSRIPINTMDNAIHDVCKAFKSALGNLKAKNISKFRLRYKKNKKIKQTILLEQSCFPLHNIKGKENKDKNELPEFFIKYLFDPLKPRPLKNTFCPTVLGNEIKTSSSIKNVNNTEYKANDL